MRRLAGNILNGLSAQQDVMEVVTTQCVYYCYLAIGAGAAGFLQAWGFSLLSERLSNRTRRAYLAALLATEVGVFPLWISLHACACADQRYIHSAICQATMTSRRRASW